MPSGYEVDEIDRRLLHLLSRNARASLKDLASGLDLSSPSVAERMRKLEARGVLRGYTIDVDPAVLGLTLEALVQIRPLPGRAHRVQRLIEEMPEVTECLKITSDDCFMVRLHVAAIGDIDRILEGVASHAETSTALVKDTPVAPRMPRI